MRRLLLSLPLLGSGGAGRLPGCASDDQAQGSEPGEHDSVESAGEVGEPGADGRDDARQQLTAPTRARRAPLPAVVKPRLLVIRGGAIGDFILTLPAIRLLRENFPQAHLEIVGYQHIVALAEGRFYADATRSIEYGPMAGFFSPKAELSPELSEYFAGFQQIVSYLFDPDGFFEGKPAPRRSEEYPERLSQDRRYRARRAPARAAAAAARALSGRPRRARFSLRGRPTSPPPRCSRPPAAARSLRCIPAAAARARTGPPRIGRPSPATRRAPRPALRADRGRRSR